MSLRNQAGVAAAEGIKRLGRRIGRRIELGRIGHCEGEASRSAAGLPATGLPGGGMFRLTALCFSLCLTLGAALGGPAWAEGAFSGSDLGFPPDIPCKKNEIPYFDRLLALEISRADWACFVAIHSPPAKGSFSRNISDTLCQQDPTGNLGLGWNTISYSADFYLYKLELVPRFVAWQSLCNILEPLAQNHEFVVGEKRKFAENMAVQRLTNPPPGDAIEFSGAELQSISASYRDLELCFAAVVQKLRIARVENYMRLPVDTRLILDGPEPVKVIFSAEETTFWQHMKQRRLDIAERLERILIRPDAGEFYPILMTSRLANHHQNINDILVLSETCAHAAATQLAVNRNLPGQFRVAVNNTIKDIVSSYLKENMENLDIIARILLESAPPEEFAQGSPERMHKEISRPYELEDAEMYRQACELVRELREYVSSM